MVIPRKKSSIKNKNKRPKKKLHGSTYKVIFSKPVAFADFLRCFVPLSEEMNFDYGSLEKVSEAHVTSHLNQKTDDIVWRLKTKDNVWHYVYVITEFQTKNYWWMVARIVEYVAELRLELIRLGLVTSGEKLPPILPIVLYRGVSRWTAPKTLDAIQIGLPEPLAFCETKEEYVLIDIHRLTQESLESETTIPSIFFRMERASNWDELQPLLQEACGHFKGEHYEEIKHIFLQWCKLVAMPRYEIDPKDIPDVITLEELSTMSYQYADEAEKEYYTKWKKDLKANLYNEAEKNASIRIAKNLAAMGMDTDKIVIVTGLSKTDVIAALQTNP